MAEISFVMPAYNSSEYIAESITSIINQTFPDWELIVVDDASTDNTQEIVLSFKDPRIHYYRNSENTGSAVLPRFRAIKESSGKWISSVDSDDYIDKNFAKELLKRQQETGSDIVFALMIKFNKDGIVDRIPSVDFDFNQIMNGKEACARTIGKWEFPYNGCCCKRELYTEDILNCKSVEQNRDDITGRQVILNASFVSFCETKYFYRQSSGSIIHRFSLGRFDNIELSLELAQLVESIYTKQSDVYSKALKSSFHTVVNYICYLHKNKIKIAENDYYSIENRLKQAFYLLGKEKRYIKSKKIRLLLGLKYPVIYKLSLIRNRIFKII